MMSLVESYTTEDWERLGRALEDARGRRSQADVAEQVQISPTTLGEIEKGRRRPRYSTLRVLEEFYQWERGTSEKILAGQLTPDDRSVKAGLDELTARFDALATDWERLDKKVDKVFSLLEVLRQLPDRDRDPE
jgi:transcriptional regulator with XRE-family HTH domain